MSERVMTVVRVALRVVGVAALLGLLVMILLGRQSALHVGEKAPLIGGVALDGGPVKNLGDGRTTVVNVWGTWCRPCVHEIPVLVAAARKYDGEVRFVGLEVPSGGAGGVKEARRAVLNLGINYEVVVIDNATIAAWHGELVPATYVVDGAGVVRFGHAGEIGAAKLDKALAKYVQ